MAATYRPIDAFDFAKNYIKRMPLEVVQAQILDSVHRRIWTAAPWRWTVGNLPEATLIAGTQDYVVTLPADYLYAIEAKMVVPEFPVRELEIVPFLPTAVIQKGQPSQIAITGSGSSGQYRLAPVPSAVKNPAEKVIGLYKKAAPKIINSNMNTAGLLVMDDEWFWVYQLGVLAYSYMFADDQRAGGGQVTGNQTQFAGMFGHFEAGLAQMRIREKLPVSVPPQNPGGKKEQG
jgi:hypothetical protein